MLHIGCHLSCAKGYLSMGEQALALGADTFQFFTRNPRGGSVKPFDRQDADALNDFLAAHQFAPILAHAPYTLNACAADASIREFAVRTMREDLERLAHIPGAMLNFHPGSHVRQGVEIGVRYIADMLDAVMAEGTATPILLETMAGKPSMRQDGEAHRKSEVELFAGTIIRRAEKFGLDVPVNRWLYDTVKQMEAGY